MEEKNNFELLEIKQKYEEAIEHVRENLETYSMLLKLGIPSVQDRVPSTGGSIITMPTGGGSSMNMGNHVAKAIDEEAKDNAFYRKYQRFLDSLEPKYKEVILNKHYYKRDCYSCNLVCNEREYLKALEEGYTLLAMSDVKVNFDCDDLIKYKEYIKNEKKKSTDVKKRVVQRLMLLKEHNSLDIPLSSDLYELKIAIAKLQIKDKQTIYDFLEDKVDFNNKTVYKLLNKALYMLAYIIQSIPYTSNQFESDMQRNGIAWKSAIIYANRVLRGGNEDVKEEEIKVEEQLSLF